MQRMDHEHSEAHSESGSGVMGSTATASSSASASASAAATCVSASPSGCPALDAAAAESPLSIAEQFHDSVQRNPSALAVFAPSGECSYAALWHRCAALCSRMQQRCPQLVSASAARAGLVVGVCAERGLDMVVAMLAVQLLGAIYLPLHSAEPPGRWEQIVREAKPALIITQRAFQHSMQEIMKQRQGDAQSEGPEHSPDDDDAVVLVEEQGIGAGESGDSTPVPARIPFFASPPSPDSVAYLVGTSGSTGAPKLVATTHGALFRGLRSFASTNLILNPHDRILQLASSSFDAHAFEIYAPLCCGAATVVLKPRGNQDLAHVAHMIQRAQVSVAFLVPSFLNSLHEHCQQMHREEVEERTGAGVVIRPPHALRSLRAAWVGGESFPPSLLHRLQRDCPWVKWSHIYGPAECFILSTYWRAQTGEEKQADVQTQDPSGDEAGRIAALEESEAARLFPGMLPIGRAFPGYETHVLNESLQVVSPGEVGELYIGGRMVFPGYFRRLDLSASVLCSMPHLSKAGPLYKTGDLVCVLPCGALVFRGRVDHQIKLRGQRMEAGEIECVLERHERVLQAVVRKQEEKGREPFLVAHIEVQAAQRMQQEAQQLAPQPEQSSDHPLFAPFASLSVAHEFCASLTSLCSARLPTFMVPTCWALYTAFPRNANGKVARALLRTNGCIRTTLSEHLPADGEDSEAEESKSMEEHEDQELADANSASPACSQSPGSDVTSAAQVWPLPDGLMSPAPGGAARDSPRYPSLSATGPAHLQQLIMEQELVSKVCSILSIGEGAPTAAAVGVGVDPSAVPAPLLDVNSPLTSYGFTSLDAMRLVAHLKRRVLAPEHQEGLSVRTIFKLGCIRQIAKFALKRSAAAGAHNARSQESGVQGPQSPRPDAQGDAQGEANGKLGNSSRFLNCHQHGQAPQRDMAAAEHPPVPEETPFGVLCFPASAAQERIYLDERIKYEQQPSPVSATTPSPSSGSAVGVASSATGLSVYSLPVLFAFRPRSSFRVSVLERALHSLLMEQQVLRTVLVETEPPGAGVLQKVLPMPHAHEQCERQRACAREADAFPSPERVASLSPCLVTQLRTRNSSHREELVRLHAFSSFPLSQRVFRAALLYDDQWSDELGAFSAERGAAAACAADDGAAASESSEVYLLFSTHHVASDGVSQALFIEKLGEWYRRHAAQSQPDSAALSPLLHPEFPRLQYIDHAILECRHMRSADVHRAQQWWRARLQQWKQQGVAATGLADATRLVQLSAAGAERSLSLPPAIYAHLHRLARASGVTFFVLYLSCVQWLLLKLVGRPSFTVGGVHVNRPFAYQERMMGAFVNTLPYQVSQGSQGAHTTFHEHVARVQEEIWATVERSAVPYQQVWQEWQAMHAPAAQLGQKSPAAAASAPPLIDVLVVLEEGDVFEPMLCLDPPPASPTPSLAATSTIMHTQRMRRVPLVKQTCMFDLIIRGVTSQRSAAAESGPDSDGVHLPPMTVVFNYNQSAFSTPLVDKLLHHMQAVLEQICAALPAELTLASTHFHTQADKQVLATLGSPPGQPLGPPCSVGAAFLEAAQRIGHSKVALIDGDVQLDFHALAVRVLTLARALREILEQRAAAHAHAAVPLPSTRIVALCVPRGTSLVVCMLAIQAVGAVYCPLNPAEPKQRHMRILRSTCPELACVICHEQMQERMADMRGEDGKRMLQRQGSGQERALAPSIMCVDSTGRAVTRSESSPSLSVSSSASSSARESDAAADDELLRSWIVPPLQSADEVSYLIHTSGSTGQPKSVCLTHRTFMNSVRGYTAVKHVFLAHDRILQVSSCSFDMHAVEILGAAVLGATLVCLPPECLYDMALFAHTVRSKQVTTMYVIPSIMAALLEHLRSTLAQEALSAFFRGLRICCMGEALPPALVRDIFRAYPNATLLNLYGPAECSIDATWHVCTAADGALGTVPIGRPFPNYSVHVLDPTTRELMPVGCEGELYIGGEGVFPGYWRAPALTAEALHLLPHLSPRALYKTGDLARVNADGELEYSGRVDFQIKLRGQRIEVAEIEAVMRSNCDAVAQVVVLYQVPRCVEIGQPMLVAYIQPTEQCMRDMQAKGIEVGAALLSAVSSTSGQPPSSDPVPLAAPALVAALQSACAQHLPCYMVPAGFVVLQRLPLNHNNKVDRSKLPRYRTDRSEKKEDAETSSSSSGASAPSLLEQQLLAVYAQILQVPAVSLCVDAGFAQLGGNSLQLIHLLSLLRQSLPAPFARCLSAAALFKHSSVRAMAAFLQQLQQEQEQMEPLMIKLDDSARITHDSNASPLTQADPAASAPRGWHIEPAGGVSDLVVSSCVPTVPTSSASSVPPVAPADVSPPPPPAPKANLWLQCVRVLALLLFGFVLPTMAAGLVSQRAVEAGPADAGVTATLCRALVPPTAAIIAFIVVQLLAYPLLWHAVGKWRLAALLPGTDGGAAACCCQRFSSSYEWLEFFRVLWRCQCWSLLLIRGTRCYNAYLAACGARVASDALVMNTSFDCVPMLQVGARAYLAAGVVCESIEYSTQSSEVRVHRQCVGEGCVIEERCTLRHACALPKGAHATPMVCITGREGVESKAKTLSPANQQAPTLMSQLVHLAEDGLLFFGLLLFFVAPYALARACCSSSALLNHPLAETAHSLAPALSRLALSLPLWGPLSVVFTLCLSIVVFRSVIGPCSPAEELSVGSWSWKRQWWLRMQLSSLMRPFFAPLFHTPYQALYLRTVGARVYTSVDIGSNLCYLLTHPANLLRIDAHCMITGNVQLGTAAACGYAGCLLSLRFEPVHLKQGTFIGNDTIVAGGVTIEEGTLVAALSYVAKQAPVNEEEESTVEEHDTNSTANAALRHRHKVAADTQPHPDRTSAAVVPAPRRSTSMAAAPAAAHSVGTTLLGIPATPLPVVRNGDLVARTQHAPLLREWTQPLCFAVLVQSVASMAVWMAILPVAGVSAAVETVWPSAVGESTVAAAFACHLLAYLLFALCVLCSSALLLVLVRVCLVGRESSTSHPQSSWLIHGIKAYLCVRDAWQDSVGVVLSGSEALCWLLRGLGAQVSHGCILHDVRNLNNNDLVSVGAHVVMHATASVQAHSFEGRILRRAPIVIAAWSELASHSLLLPAVTLGSACVIEPNTCIMKADQLQAHSRWRGNPSRQL